MLQEQAATNRFLVERGACLFIGADIMNATGNYATHEMDSCCQPNSTHLAYADALRLLDHCCQDVSPKTETIPLTAAVHRVLAQDVVLDRDEPPLARSAMDGFAVLHGDGVSPREIVAVNYAGDVGELILIPGQAIKVMTGASVPTNADAVVMVEHCQVQGAQLNIDAMPSKSNIRQVGELASRGAVAVKSSQMIGGPELAALASCGVDAIDVYQRPRVAIISTGNEVVPYAGVVRSHQTRDSNRIMLEAQLTQYGARVISTQHVADDVKLLSTAINSVMSLADLVVTVGGVSMGDKDYLPQVFRQLKVEQLFHKVAIRPAKPIWAGHRNQTMVIGLPGNPVSSFVGAVLFVRPIIDAWLGDFSRRTTPRLAIAGAQFQSKARHDFVVSCFDAESKIVPTHSSGSADWRSLATAQQLALIPPNSIISSDDLIEVIPV